MSKEADRIGTELALARGFDPEEAVRFWERQHERFGKRSLSPKIGNSLFGSHPRDRVRAENLRGHCHVNRVGPQRPAWIPFQAAALALSHTLNASFRNRLNVSLLRKCRWT